MPIDWSPFVEFVSRHQRFLIMTHVRPDGDALGSQIGLAEALKQLGKSVRIVVASNLGPRYEFLNENSQIERFVPPGDPFREIDAIIIVDTGTWGQIGDFGPFMKEMKVGKAVIDHHRTQDDLEALRFVDIDAEAAGRLIYEATLALNVPVTPTAATALFMALATDTGWFRHSSTTPKTFDLAEELTRAGARPVTIYDALYEQNTLGRWKLLGRALERMTSTADGKIVYTEIFLKDYAETGGIPSDTEDLINFPRSVTGVLAALVFIEQPNGETKVSFRCKENCDVGQVAERFGGGGHRLAAGATVKKTLAETREEVLAAVRDSLP
jgi:phosphoesterase RecJ-like protein